VTIKRVLAFLAAAALIVAALLIRNGLDDTSASGSDSTDGPSGGSTTVVCSTQLADVCNGLGKSYSVTIESAANTLSRLSADGAQLPDAWITLDPFPGMLDTLRTVANLAPLTPEVTAIGADTPVLAVPTARNASVAAGCAGQAVWKCLGGAAGNPWTSLDANAAGGDVLVGITDPATEDLGLITFANAVAGYFGVVQQDNGSFHDPGFTGWLRTFSNNAHVVSAGSTPLGTLLVRKSEVNVAASTTREIASNAQRATVSALAVSPAISPTVVVGSFTSRGRSVATKAAPLFLAAGWTAPTAPQPQLPAGTFVALRALWKEYNK
jgi:hypothetical protein